MWAWLHPYAKTQAVYNLCNRFYPWFWWPGCIALAIGIVWGLAYAPADYQQGDAFRIIYIHVPAAILSMGLYSSMAIMAFVGLVWQLKVCFVAIAAIAPVGAVMTFAALLTGAVWGKPMWGTWWEWDARLTSELILLFLYFGIMALQGAFQDQQQGAKAAAVMALVGVVNLPIIHYSVYWWNTLHQGATILKFSGPSIAPDMLWPLLFCILGFALYAAAIVVRRLQNEIMAREHHRPWVVAMVTGEDK